MEQLRKILLNTAPIAAKFQIKNIFLKGSSSRIPPHTGKPIWNMLGIRRRMAASTSCGRFVAPITMTLQSLSVISPSQKLMNCVLIIAVASWSVADLDRRKESGEKVTTKLHHSITDVSHVMSYTTRTHQSSCSSVLFKMVSQHSRRKHIIGSMEKWLKPQWHTLPVPSYPTLGEPQGYN